METDDNPIKEVFDDLFTLLEALETQNIAALQFLKDQGIAADDKLAPYLDRAGAASSVKWRAARARMNYLLAPAPKKASEPSVEKQPQDEEVEPKNAKSEEAKPEYAAAKTRPERNTAPKDAAPKQSETEGEERKSEEPRPGAGPSGAPGTAQGKDEKPGAGEAESRREATQSHKPE